MYDILNPYAADTAFYLDLAARLRARSIVDVGCGTGLLAVELARGGALVVGLDPSAAMLEAARSRRDGEQVRWISGDARALDVLDADLVLMTGHVAQILADERTWRLTLHAARRALRVGGHLAFESRNPRARAWERWTREGSTRILDNTPLGRVETWDQVTAVEGDLVTFASWTLLRSRGETIRTVSRLRFRTRAAIERELQAAGFSVQEVFGDFDREPAGPESRELVFVARAEQFAGDEDVSEP